MLLSLLIYVVLVPGLVTVAVVLGLARPWSPPREDAGASRGAAIGPALALGLVVTTIAQHGFPDLVPVIANDRLPQIALLAALACLPTALIPSPVTRWSARVLVAVITAWLVIGPLARLAGMERLLYIALGAASLVGYWDATRRALAGEHRLVAAALGILVAGSAAVAIGASGSAKLAEVAGTLAASLGGLFVVSLVFARTPSLENGAGVVAMVTGGAVILAHAFSRLPLVPVILFALVPVAFAVTRRALAGRVSERLATAGRLAVAVVLIAVAVGLAAMPSRTSGQDSTGYPYDSESGSSSSGDDSYNYAY